MPNRTVYRGTDVAQLQRQVADSERHADKWRRAAHAAQRTIHYQDGRAAAGAAPRGPEAAPRGFDKYTLKAVLEGADSCVAETDETAKRSLDAVERILQAVTETEDLMPEADLDSVLTAIEPLQKRLKTSAQEKECSVMLAPFERIGSANEDNQIAFGLTCTHLVSHVAAAQLLASGAPNRCPVCRAENWMSAEHLALLATCRAEIAADRAAGRNGGSNETGEAEFQELLTSGKLALVPAPFDPANRVMIVYGPHGCQKKSEETETRKVFNMYMNKHIFTGADPKFVFSREEGKVWHRPVGASAEAEA